jgi:hypothetical protein
MNTDQLIERLAERLPPVRPLRRPAVRAAVWLCGAALYLGLMTLSMTSAADVTANSGASRFVVPQLAAIVTGILAAVAAFASVVPGYSRRVLIWPLVAGAFWVASLAIGSRGEWSQPAALLSAPREWICVAVIALGGAPLVAALSVMLRRGAAFNPAMTAALAALSVGVLANVGACVSHPHTSSSITLVWHGAAILGIVALAAASGRIVLRWNTSQG